MGIFKLWIPSFNVKIRKTFLLSLILVFSGCGGGGSSSDNAAPEAVFTVSTDSGLAPLTVNFNATGSSDSDGTISSYSWRFGDSGTGSGSTVQHTYQSAGTYTAQLTVADNDGSTDTATHQITVSANPAALSYTIQGTVNSAGHMTSDSDVNDPNANYVSNDSFSSAQDPLILRPGSSSSYPTPLHHIQGLP